MNSQSCSEKRYVLDTHPNIMACSTLVKRTSPQACPSGVSAGQMMPHCVLCSCRGFASLPSRPTGELMRLKWESVLA